MQQSFRELLKEAGDSWAPDDIEAAIAALPSWKLSYSHPLDLLRQCLAKRSVLKPLVPDS